MKVVLAEKPSVAKGIASILGATNRKDGYLEGNGYQVTWAYGHLIGLAAPDAYGWKGKWDASTLPMIPERFIIKPIELADKESNILYSKQLKTIFNLFKKAELIIEATDAGREGELIFRYIINYLFEKESRKPQFVRLWISSLTDKAIKDGFENLKPGKQYDNMYKAGKARSEADWLIGINATRAVTLNVDNGSVWSIGRVQTPTLSMICKRFIENRDFRSVPFYTIRIISEKDNIKFYGTNPTKFEKKEDAINICEKFRLSNNITVTKVEKKPAYSMPPLLYDLTTIQKEANSKFGFSAEMTLMLCQSLYEKKLTTYPRTGSRYIPDDVYETLPLLVHNAEKYPRYKEYAASLRGKFFGKISVNAAKVTDHHALLPTENIPEEGQMTDAEKKIYEMIVGRMLETISPKQEKDVTTATLIVDGYGQFPFTIKGSIIKINGWKSVMGEKEKVSEDENISLPPLVPLDKLPMIDVELQDKKTKAPSLLTENTLLELMESAGKEVENEEEREALKDIGLGTPATRADIIEKLLKIKYIEREKRNLIPTEKGLALYSQVKDMQIANAAMTGKWEAALNKIGQGKLDVETYNQEIRNYTKCCTAELLNIKLYKGKIKAEGPTKLEMTCPDCGEKFIVSEKACYCSNKQKCGFWFYRIVCQRRLTEKDLKELLEKGETSGEVKLKKKDGKTFTAKLKLNKMEHKVELVFKKK